MAIRIRELSQNDKEGWRAMWRGYQHFYEADLTADEERLWSSLMMPGADGPYALVAEGDNGELIGLAQYLFHISTWSAAQRCYLNDLFTMPQARGQGVARSLVEEVYRRADARGVGQVWWLTQEFNATAQLLYDKIAKRTPFIKYAR